MASGVPPTSTVNVKAETPPTVDVFSTLRKDLNDALSNPLVDDIRTDLCNVGPHNPAALTPVACGPMKYGKTRVS